MCIHFTVSCVSVFSDAHWDTGSLRVFWGAEPKWLPGKSLWWTSRWKNGRVGLKLLELAQRSGLLAHEEQSWPSHNQICCFSPFPLQVVTIMKRRANKERGPWLGSKSEILQTLLVRCFFLLFFANVMPWRKMVLLSTWCHDAPLLWLHKLIRMDPH